MMFLSLGPFYGAIAVPSVTRCRCRRRRRCGRRQRRRRATVATPGEWQCKKGGVRRLAVANGPYIFQMLLVLMKSLLSQNVPHYLYQIFSIGRRKGRDDHTDIIFATLQGRLLW